MLPPASLEEIGYRIAAYPLTLLSASLAAMLRALDALREGRPADGLLDFAELRKIVGFDDYDREQSRYTHE